MPPGPSPQWLGPGLLGGGRMKDLARAIHEAATAKIRAQERRRKAAHDETVRRQRRSTSDLPVLKSRDPIFWAYDSSHNPYHVRARASSISHAVDLAIKGGVYRPFPPAGFSVPKAGGKSRTVTTFAIADEVVSRRLYDSLMNKNRARLSARSYAYRKDLGVHDAIAHMQSEWSDEHRLFVAQYDFTDYFGSIDHDHVMATISALALAITRTERRLLRSFMEAPLPTIIPASMPLAAPRRVQGIHQGTTISLLLANIAATPLDREFERLGVSFTRYADDIVVWSRDYSNLSRAVDELHRFAERSRCRINHKKSKGVHLLTDPHVTGAEFQSIHDVEFLSNRVALRSVSLSDRSITLAREATSEYIFNHLLREPLAGSQDMRRIKDGLDRDYLALLSQLRRYLYGSLSEEQLRRLLRGPLPPMMSLGGLLGRHPLANDLEQLRALDSWMATQIWLALRKRARLVGGSGKSLPEPWGFTVGQLCEFMTKSTRGRRLPVDGRLPSAVRMSELVRRAVRAHGTRVATHAGSLYNWG
ncbi:reverse transcriptase domain-containing protein [Isoptericola cucumis]|uniref:reverse transcriptase domain-containing protein n=1 Tax=Isoptericola cucumis TaxID=1776856 RepID=UPI003208481C